MYIAPFLMMSASLINDRQSFLYHMSSASFRIRRTPTELEVEFSGETSDTLKKFDEIMKMSHGVPLAVEKSKTNGYEPNGKRQFKRTGELKNIRDHSAALKSEGFFKQPKSLGEIRSEMRTKGWFHEPNNIQSALLRNGAELGVKRIKEGKNYRYVGNG